MQNRISYFNFIFFQNIAEYEEFLNEKFLHGGVNITGFKFLTKKHWDVAVTKELKKKNTVEQNYTMSVIFRHTYMINMFLKRYFYMFFLIYMAV